MSTKKDIIERVKELRELWKGCDPVGCSIACTKTRQQFPAIADAILIAVEALEITQKRLQEKTKESPDSDIPAWIGIELLHQKNALSRIRSL